MHIPGEENVIEDLKKLYCKYTPTDVIESLSIGSIWLNNISTEISHLFLLAIAFSIPKDKFTGELGISSYDEFKSFLDNVYRLTPQFPEMQDYLPEADWKEIKYSIGDKNYWMLYGGSLATPYDFMYSFEIIHSHIEYPTNILPPIIFFEELLKTHEILSINIKNKLFGKLYLRKLEVPRKTFWNESRNLYRNKAIWSSLREDFLSETELKLGSVIDQDLQSESFRELAYYEDILKGFFYISEDLIIPILPRRFLYLMYDKYGRYLEDNFSKLSSVEDFVNEARIPFSHFVKRRFRKNDYFLMLSPFKEKPIGQLFDFTFISNSTHYLVKLLNPYISEKSYKAYMNKLDKDLTDSMSIIENNSLEYFDHLNTGIIRFDSKHQTTLKPKFIFIVPTLNNYGFKKIIKKNSTKAEVFFLHDFLGIVDNSESVDELAKFIDYLSENKDPISTPFISNLDILGSYMDSNGVLIEGAEEPSFLVIDPNWGSEYRFRLLKEFWSIFKEIEYLPEVPRALLLKRFDTGSIGVMSRDRDRLYTCINYENIHFVIRSPHKFQKPEVSQISNFIVEIFEYYLLKYGKQVCELLPMQALNLHILIFPDELLNSDQFAFLKTMENSSFSESWKIDSGYLSFDPPLYGVRILYNYEDFTSKFIGENSKRIEVQLVQDFLSELSKSFGFTINDSLTAEIESDKTSPSLFKLKSFQLPVTYPTNEGHALKPGITELKMARKHFAELAKSVELEPGIYNLQDAKSKVALVIEKAELDLRSKLERYNYKKSLIKLIENIEALQDEEYRDKLSAELYLSNEYGKQKKEDFVNKNSEFISDHKNYRLLIEKLENYKPMGANVIENNEISQLLAFIDLLYVLYYANDALHYEINPVSLTVKENFLLEVNYESDLQENQKMFEKYIYDIEHGYIGNLNDKIDHGMEAETIISDLDSSFIKDYGFNLTNLFQLLSLMSVWGNYSKDKKVNETYIATLSELNSAFVKVYPEFVDLKLEPILDFVTLNTTEKDLQFLPGSKVKVIPIWESQKRPNRYTFRPVIKIDDKYIWGPYSVYKASGLWTTNYFPYGYHPIEQGLHTKKVIDKYKDILSKELEKKAFEITKRFTNFAEKDFKPHKRLKDIVNDNTYGDFDVLSYLEGSNSILSIECNDLVPPFVPKDSKRLWRTLFGDPKASRTVEKSGKIGKILKRETFLKEHYQEIAKVLNWPLKNNPKIYSIYVSRRTYWWTVYPPLKTGIEFVRIDTLNDYLDDIEGKIKSSL